MTAASHPLISSTTVHVIDDDSRIRASLVDFFASVGLKATAYARANDFMEQADLSEPGCVLLDVRMPGMTGLELQEKLSALECPLPIIFMTGDACVEASVSAMKAGAFDFILKPLNLETLAELTALALSRNGETRLKYLARFRAQSVVDTLTPRESEVFVHVSKGLPNKAIAREMNISEIMVKLHRSRMMKKLQARSVVDVVRTFDDVNTAKANDDQLTARRD